MFLNDEDMVECPYDSTHRMLRKRLQPHLLKCRRHHKDVELRKCPFNIMHLIPEPEYAHHATNCPDRKLITQYKYDAPEQKEEEIPKHAPVECDENWDDTEVVDYNPKLYLKKASVLLRPDGASRSERKLFMKKERKRLGDEDSSDDDIKKESIFNGNKRNKYDFETRSVNNGDEAYDQGPRSRYSRQMSPCSSSTYKQRSPTSEMYDRNPLYSTSWGRSPREYSPPSHGSSTYTRKYTLPSHSHFDTAEERYHMKGRRTPNNDQYNSGRDAYYSYNDSHQAYNDHYLEENDIMPEAPPPPTISYPTPPTYSSRYSYPPFSDR